MGFISRSLLKSGINGFWKIVGSKIDGLESNAYSGSSVSINDLGDIVVIGEPGYDGGAGYGGLVRVFEWNGTAWTQKGSNLIPADGKSIGTSVSINSIGNIIVIGCPTSDGPEGGGSNYGKTIVYEWDGTIWVKKGQSILGKFFGERSGWSVSINSTGNIIATGSLYTNNVGCVRIYEWSGTDWIQKGSDINGSYQSGFFGYSISINSTGDTISVGAPTSDANGVNSGMVGIHYWDGNNWIQKGSDIVGKSAYDQCGSSVSINSNGNIIAIGCVRSGSFVRGYAMTYEWNGVNWVQLGSDFLSPTLSPLKDSFGVAVSINSSGNIVSIGCGTVEQSSFPNTRYPSFVQTYSFNGNYWIKRGSAITSSSTIDNFGNTVSINAAGDTVAIGAPDNFGKTEIYQFYSY